MSSALLFGGIIALRVASMPMPSRVRLLFFKYLLLCAFVLRLRRAVGSIEAQAQKNTESPGPLECLWTCTCSGRQQTLDA